MKSQPTKSNVEITGPIVKIAWLCHNRRYEIGIQRFLETAGVKLSDEEILAAISKLLAKQ
jgi:hypothetical protein